MSKVNHFQKTNILVITLILITVLTIILSIIYIISNKPLVIFPAHKDFAYDAYCDNVASRINRFTAFDNRITFHYTLGEGKTYPFAGITINKKDDSSFIDLSKYDSVSIVMETEYDKSLTFHINTYSEEITDENSHLSYIFFQYTFYINKNTTVYKLNLKDFSIPQWWLDYHSLTENQIPIDFSKVHKIALANGPLYTLNKMEKISIRKIQFKKGQKKAAFPIILIIISIFILIILIFIMQKKSTIRTIPYESLSISGEKNEDLIRITDYIAAHYHDMNLTIDTISTNINIASYKISQLLKNHFQLSYPVYINTIRITEAKRLLKETDMKVIDIAMSIGYKNVSHFNRIFKKATTMSPLQFRSQSR